MRLIDTHAHLDFPTLSEDLDATLQRARDAGVQRIVTIGASRGLDSNHRAIEIARRYPQIRCTAGIHPHDADMTDEQTFGQIRDDFASDEQVVGIGETGLDYFYDRADVDRQKWSFRQHLELAKTLGKPVIIHSRDADEDCIAMLEDAGVTHGILHCFTGGRWMAERLWEMGFYLSFSGIVTFKSGRELLEIAADTPADRILFETDSPFLAPVPKRGKTNEPAHVQYTAKVLAEARGVDPERFADQVWANAARVFAWPDADHAAS